MRDPARVNKIIGALHTLWEIHPDMRLGQLVANLCTDEDQFNLEDDEMQERILSAINNRWPKATRKTCPEHGDELVFEQGGPDMPTIAGRLYCPTCQHKLMEALDAQD